jgi:FKBP-type peptidyl-prolyl cis-trans isomerase
MRALARLAPVLLAVLCGCAAFRPEPIAVTPLSWTTEGGVVVHELVQGTGEQVAVGRLATIEYTGWLQDGTEFDSTHDRGTPYAFVVGEAAIAGFDEGIAGMHAGGRRRMEIPPELAYGDQGVDELIPPGATLVFEVELVAVEDP